MEKVLEGNFYNPTQGQLTLERVMEEMVNYMSQKPDNFYDIIVGCDSSSGEAPNFPLAVAILRVGEGGRFFLKKITYPDPSGKRFVNWKSRILQEVLLSCELALFLRENFGKKVSCIKDKTFNYQLRYIHADIGEKGKTRDMIKELTGLIVGNGFEPKIKPESCIASVLADRYS